MIRSIDQVLLCACLVFFGCLPQPESRGASNNRLTSSIHQIDTLRFQVRLDHDACWISQGHHPVISGIPEADMWNDSIAAYEKHLKESLLDQRSNSIHGRTFCCGSECDGDEYIDFPRGEGWAGSFGFKVLSNNRSTLSLLLTCNIHFSEGSLNWNECHAINIDPRSGRAISIDPCVKQVPLEQIDAGFRDCIFTEACTSDQRQYVHSLLFPNVVEEAVATHRIGIQKGHWVLCQDFNLKHCAQMAQNICAVPICVMHPSGRQRAENSK